MKLPVPGRLAAGLWLACIVPCTTAAQTPDSLAAARVPRIVKVGKWALLGATVGMGAIAIGAHRQADEAYEDLEAYCAPDRTRCDLDSHGDYIDPVAEEHYQESLSYDRKARRWFIGGEVALVGAAVLFIWDFSKPDGRPPNIPFDPELRVGPTGTQLRLRMAF